MEQNNVFKLKKGYCHILEDKLVFSKKEILKHTDSIKNKNRIWMARFIYGSLFMSYLLFIYKEIMRGVYPSWFTCVVCIAFLYLFVKSYMLSKFPIIYRDQIQKIQYISPVKGIIRGHFKVFFTDENKTEHQQLIILPGTLSGGHKEYERVIDLFDKTGLSKLKTV